MPVKKKSFAQKFSMWRKETSPQDFSQWTEQLRILNEVTDLITPTLSLEEIVAAIYENVNHLLDAYQFAVGIYNETEGTLLYKGMIENGKSIPEFAVDINDSNRLAAWCIRNEEEIFMNDFDKEITRYLLYNPQPLAGKQPKAALYTPLKLEGKTVGLITVRTIHKNVYSKHHMHLLKAVGNFVVRALEMGRMYSIPFTKGSSKVWSWSNTENLPYRSKKILNLLSEREKEVLFLLVTAASNKEIGERLFVSSGTIKHIH